MGSGIIGDNCTQERDEVVIMDSSNGVLIMDNSNEDRSTYRTPWFIFSPPILNSGFDRIFIHTNDGSHSIGKGVSSMLEF